MEHEFITGQAGTGKTTLIRQRMSENYRYGALCATTGIAAVNLGSIGDDPVTTINSALGYYDTNDMTGKHVQGKITSNLIKLLKARGPRLIVDEISMLGADQLDIIYQAMTSAEESIKGKNHGLILTGDFLQLPPVKAPWAFKSVYWDKFEQSTTALSIVHRQTNRQFLDALGLVRRGNNIDAPNALADIPSINWRPTPDHNFDGTTIFAVNKQVDRLNLIRLNQLKQQGAKSIEFRSYRWGKQKPEWKLVPESLEVSEQSYVMILVNNTPDFTYANGDCGDVVGIDNGANCTIQLRRNGAQVTIPWVTRRYESRETPEGMSLPEVSKSFSEWKRHLLETAQFADEDISALAESDQKGRYKKYLIELTSKYKQWGRPYYDWTADVWVLGEIVYMPLRLAWATTTHKSQGLTLDNIQVDFSHGFFGGPSMAYVALSRVRQPEGLVIVGNTSILSRRIKAPMECERWF